MMRKYSKILLGGALVAAVIGVGILLGWWGSREKPRPQATPSVATPSPLPAVGVKPPSTRPELTSGPPPTAAVGTSTPPATAAVPAAAGTNVIADWEDKLDTILGSDDEDTNKVKQLLAMFPRLPEEGQTEVAQHLSNLVPDDDYGPLGQLLENPKTSESVLDVLMSDVLNRPNSVKLPLLLQLAQNPDHPKAEEAKDLVELYLDEEDPAKWPQKMQEWLKDNPD
jgi:hypothetical protein